jgi:two-component system phosphate regulon response regulator OmpR
MRILTVDDEEDTRLFMKDLLSRAGHAVTTAASAVEALVHLRMQAFDLIVLDIMMPGMDGHQFATTVSGGWDTFDIPILVVSGRDDRESRMWARMNGVRRYIEKPFAPAELLDAINELARRSKDVASHGRR